MEKQLSEINLVELKALAYDHLSQIEFLQNNLRAINQELARRAQQPPNQLNPIEPLPPGSIRTV
jgi:uncharacterized membrane protein YccC